MTSSFILGRDVDIRVQVLRSQSDARLRDHGRAEMNNGGDSFFSPDRAE
jgi:hypothetical protein